jgi:hypothetical protein
MPSFSPLIRTPLFCVTRVFSMLTVRNSQLLIWHLFNVRGRGFGPWASVNNFELTSPLACRPLILPSNHLTTWSLRARCGLGTSGWSLPGVMSDWQHGVDWFLAKYCRCRLWLDWCWCRWRTSAKVRCRWGLQVWRRVLVRGTRWLAGSSAIRMVERTAIWSHGRFLGWASKPRSSRDYVGAEHEWWLAEATLSSRGFRWFTRKPLGSLVDPQGKTKEPKTEVQQHQTGLTGGYRSDRWVHRSNRCATTQLEIFEVEDTRRDSKACMKAKQVCGRWASVRWCEDKDFQIRYWGACIPS